ncbi:MAG: alkaline phosphatase D family protein [Chitinophagales bacterium]
MKSCLRLLLPLILTIPLLTGINACKTDPVYQCPLNYKTDTIPLLSRIAFGSCADQTLDQSILYKVVEKQPQLFIYLGDNIYGDTYNMHELQSEYGQLSCKPEFEKLVSSCRVVATWDDHDFGHNDVGVEYPYKEESKNIFLNFWGEGNNAERHSHSGIYTSYYFGDSAHLVQVLLLDLRTFRTPLKENKYGYYPNTDSAATFLGGQQWQWLQNELSKPAKLRIIGSSSRFDTEADGGECWENFPVEIQRMFQLIRTTQANGVLFISGDIHFAELCKRTEPNLYPVYDFTASPIARHANDPWPNAYQIASAPVGYNFGMIEVDWNKPDPEILLRSYNLSGTMQFEQRINLSEIYF